MKKRRILISIALLFCIGTASCIIFLRGSGMIPMTVWAVCGREKRTLDITESEVLGAGSGNQSVISLLAAAESEEQAVEIAEMYGITYIACSDGVALFESGIAFGELTQIGEENGYPELSLNYARKTY